MINYGGKELTINQARKELESDDRKKRKEIWSLIAEKQLEHKDDIESVFDRLFSIRNIIAKNAGLKISGIIYLKKKKGLTTPPSDCFEFHASVEKEIVPLVKEISLKNKKRLGLDDYRPFDVPGLAKARCL